MQVEAGGVVVGGRALDSEEEAVEAEAGMATKKKMRSTEALEP